MHLLQHGHSSIIAFTSNFITDIISHTATYMVFTIKPNFVFRIKICAILSRVQDIQTLSRKRGHQPSGTPRWYRRMPRCVREDRKNSSNGLPVVLKQNDGRFSFEGQCRPLDAASKHSHAYSDIKILHRRTPRPHLRLHRRVHP